VISSHPKVEKAIVQAIGKTFVSPTFTGLVSHLVLRSTNESEVIPAIRSYLTSKLPPYMIPSQILIVPNFPLSDNGKVDRRALLRAYPPSGEAKQTEEKKGMIKQLEISKEEKLLAKCWKEVLQIEKKTNLDLKTANFFELGGHSLLVIRLASVHPF